MRPVRSRHSLDAHVGRAAVAADRTGCHRCLRVSSRNMPIAPNVTTDLRKKGVEQQSRRLVGSRHRKQRGQIQFGGSR